MRAGALTATAVERFHREGFLGPFALCAEGEMISTRERVEALLGGDGAARPRVHNRHLDSRIVYDLATDPGIVGRVASILGEDLLLWRTNFFLKEPGGKEIPWHQDANYWRIEPAVVVSAWLAIDGATVENSCVRLIPGSHRAVVPHVASGPLMAFHEMADPAHVETGRAIDMELRPGGFFLFNERTLHHSGPNRSQRRRLGLSIRMVPPIVRMLERDSPDHRMLVVSGRDTMGFNPTREAPSR